MGSACTKDDAESPGELIKDLLVPLDEIEFGNMINSGACGQVFEGTYKDKPVAIKYGKLGRKNHKTVLSEIEALRTFSHPNIVKLYGVAESENGFYLILERGVKNLDQWIRSGNNIDILSTVNSIVSALTYMHSFNPPYIHRDIKPSNILVMENGSVKISDFGLSCHESTLGRHMSDVGTPSFVAPEVSTHSYDERVDIYSLGLLIYFLISKGQYKAQDSEENKDIFRMNFISKTLYLLYKQCTEIDPADRPTLQDIQLRINKLIKYSKKSSSRDFSARKHKVALAGSAPSKAVSPILVTGMTNSSSGHGVLATTSSEETCPSLGNSSISGNKEARTSNGDELGFNVDEEPLKEADEEIVYNQLH